MHRKSQKGIHIYNIITESCNGHGNNVKKIISVPQVNIQEIRIKWKKYKKEKEKKHHRYSQFNKEKKKQTKKLLLNKLKSSIVIWS